VGQVAVESRERAVLVFIYDRILLINTGVPCERAPAFACAKPLRCCHCLPRPFGGIGMHAPTARSPVHETNINRTTIERRTNQCLGCSHSPLLRRPRTRAHRALLVPISVRGFCRRDSSDTSVHDVQFQSVINIFCSNTTSAQYASI